VLDIIRTDLELTIAFCGENNENAVSRANLIPV
jgi:hypothetical protein